MVAKVKFSHISAGAIAVLVGYTSSVAIIFQAIDASGATAAQAASWMMALGLGMGLTCLILSLRYRMPILTAWSTPGAALLAVGLHGIPMSDAIGAFLFSGVLLTLTGLTGWFEKIAGLIPDSLANAMLAGILFQFGLDAVRAAQVDFALVAVMTTCFIAGRLYFARYTIPVTFLLGCLWAGVAGSFGPLDGFDLALTAPIFVMPSFSLPVLIGVGLPLYIVTMCSQNMPGVVTLKGAGYEPPVSASMTITGLASTVLAPFGGFAFNLAAITAAICAGPEADEDPNTRYIASVMAGIFYCIVGLGGAAVISLFLIAPQALVATIAGLALLSTIGNSLSAALGQPSGREAALMTFMITVSGISFWGIGAAFWALLVGMLVNHLLARPLRKTPTATTQTDVNTPQMPGHSNQK
ncbi:benzoate/H(+) symporter BenE family transporter [Epibacterium sp. SM1969]|uniref:Benzoate/H(+) symporter BenE family transporter n=1 Tax=Tritonibacter aquimaris TaxID=2663379 RepID=A0A844B079_9RHOB|nr:benzoate/H(+) symporter BenE family transporter [Tritonibacter aquimaris]MQY43551.1 benzoate/H(+) symporter BenE family transporter [Tritonibacter aquimaris]